MVTPKLVWSPIHLRMENQQKIIHFGRLELVFIDIEGVRSTTTFEVIEIVDDSNPYPTLSGLDWDFENLSMVNLKNKHLVFEQGDLKVISALYPKEVRMYVEIMREVMDVEGLDNIYKLTP